MRGASAKKSPSPIGSFAYRGWCAPVPRDLNRPVPLLRVQDAHCLPLLPRFPLQTPFGRRRVVLVPRFVPRGRAEVGAVSDDGAEQAVVEQGLVVGVCIVWRARKRYDPRHDGGVVLEELHAPRYLL